MPAASAEPAPQAQGPPGATESSEFESDARLVRGVRWRLQLAPPLRAGHETSYYPGEINLRMADVIVVNKMDSASIEQVNALMDTIHQVNPAATVVDR